jgi:formylmethanofuran dehydrogenase subunit E
MVIKENHCVNCGLPCLGPSCPNRNVEVYYCDKCNEELPHDKIYDVDDEELCEECLKEKFIRR